MIGILCVARTGILQNYVLHVILLVMGRWIVEQRSSSLFSNWRTMLSARSVSTTSHPGPEGDSRESQGWHGDNSKVRPGHPNYMNQSPHPSLAGLPARIFKVSLQLERNLTILSDCPTFDLTHSRWKKFNSHVPENNSGILKFYLRITRNFHEIVLESDFPNFGKWRLTESCTNSQRHSPKINFNHFQTISSFPSIRIWKTVRPRCFSLRGAILLFFNWNP